MVNNKKYKTKKINGYDAVHIKDIPLKHGRISSQNSMPYIRLDYVSKLQDLDNQMGATGNKYKITSNIGGSHAGGARSHSNFEKMDIAPENGTIFNNAAINYLNNNWVGNGAIGNEGDHWDLSFNAKGGRMDQNILRPAPGLMNAGPQIMNLYNTGQITSAQMYDLMKKQQEELASRYDVGRARNEAQQRIVDTTADAIPQINEQMYQNIDDPIVFQMAQQKAMANKQGARDIANRDLALAQGEYYNQRTPQQMTDEYNAQIERFLNYMASQNPYVQAQAAQVQPYNVDPNEYAKALARDNSMIAYNRAAAMLNANSNPRLAEMQIRAAQQGQNTAEQYLRDAQMQYNMNVANQLGLPPEVVQKQMEHQMKLAEALAPGASSAYKEAAVLQPNQNLRTYMTEIPKQAENIYGDTVTDENQNMQDLLSRNKMYGYMNTPAANAMVNSVGDVTQMESKYPQQTLDKFGIVAGNVSKPNQAMIQGTSSMTGNAMKSVQDNAQNVNNNLMDIYEEQGKDLRKWADIANQSNKTTRAEEKSNALKKAKEKQSLVNSVLSKLSDISTGYPQKGTEEQFMNVLRNTGEFTEKELADLVMMYYR